MLVLAGILAAVGGLMWLSFAAIGSDNLDAAFGEVGRNRLWTPALFGWLAGVLIPTVACWRRLSGLIKVGALFLAAGLLLMLSGNVAEYWFLSDLPHQGPEGFARGLAWMTFLLGFLVLLLSLPLCGIALLRARAPGWIGAAVIAVTPLTIGAIFVNLDMLVVPLAVLSIIMGGYLIAHPRTGGRSGL